jgi:hypothetical protein
VAATTPILTRANLPAGMIQIKGGAFITGTMVRLIPEKVEIRTPNGIIEIPSSQLDPLICARLFPESSDAAKAVLIDELVKYKMALIRANIDPDTGAAFSPSPSPSAEPETPAKELHSGLNIVSFDAKEISREYDHSTIAWKVELLNNSDAPISDIYVHFSFQDKDSFELDDAIEDDVSLKPGERKTVTSTTLMKSDIWDKVDSYHVKTD